VPSSLTSLAECTGLGICRSHHAILRPADSPCKYYLDASYRIFALPGLATNITARSATSATASCISQSRVRFPRLRALPLCFREQDGECPTGKQESASNKGIRAGVPARVILDWRNIILLPSRRFQVMKTTQDSQLLD
jgi:hypothetical protein